MTEFLGTLVRVLAVWWLVGIPVALLVVWTDREW